MADDKDYRVVSKRELMPSILLDLMNKANDVFARASDGDAALYLPYSAYVRQLHGVLFMDIERLDDKAKFALPTSRSDWEGWQKLQVELWSLARKKGHVGTDEKRLDFNELITTLKGGMFSNEK